MRIAVVGSINTDLTIRVPHIAARNETVVGTGNFVIAQGGKGANQAVAAAAAGGDVAMIGMVGDDGFGADAIASIEAAGVNCDHIVRSGNHSTGLASILVDENGDNAIAVAPGANDGVTPAMIERSESIIRDAGILVVQLEIPNDPVNAAVRIAKRHDTKVILNPAPARPEGLDCLASVDFVTPNEPEALALTGVSTDATGGPAEIAGALMAKGIDHVALTLGARGCFIAQRDMTKAIDAPVVESVDTTGAGDAFTGFLAASLAKGLGFEQASQIAVAAASLSVTREGARTNLPTWDEVEAFQNG